MNTEKQNPNNEVATNYRAELTFDDESTCTVTASSLDTVKHKIQKLLPGPKLRFELYAGQNEQGGMKIFHDSHFDAKQPIGWIASYDIPLNLSVQSVTQARLGQQRAA